MKTFAAALSLLVVLQASCRAVPATGRPPPPPTAAETQLPQAERRDGARRVLIPVEGSLQNPAWSPDGRSVLFTRFRAGYNAEPADLLVADLHTGTVAVLVSDGSANVNLPGASWNARTDVVVFSSSREPHDEIYRVAGQGGPGDEVRITDRADRVAYEPSQSPDGQWVVFESHELDVEGQGVIVKYKIDGSMAYQQLTDPDQDCRQPNWSPTGERLLYQKYSHGQWDIWTMGSDGTNHQRVTDGDGDKTDASFSPDGAWIVFSGSPPGLEIANLYVVPVTGGPAIRVTDNEGYDGAPSWSPDGRWIVFESSAGDPDGGPGTALWVIAVPSLSR